MSERIGDNWARGDSYERYVGRWSRRVAPMFLDWLRPLSGAAWADIGCGTGALSATILDRCAPSSVTGVEPSPGFLETAGQNLGGRATLHQGSATSIPLGDASVDYTVSGLVLNFVADAPAAIVEMSRITRRDGVVAAYVWDYAGKMQLMQHFWDAAVALDARASPIAEQHRFPNCSPDALRTLFTNDGLEDVEVAALELPMPFRSFDDYWEPFLGGAGPAPVYVANLDEAARSALRERLRQRLPIAADGSIALEARAWAVRGAVRR